MSAELCVFLDDATLPTLADWQNAILESGYGLQLDDCSPRDHTGFWPTRLNGVDCGFEYFFSPIESNEPQEVLAKIGDRSHVVTFVFRGDEKDCRAAMYASAVLARLSAGVFYDPQSGDFVPGDRVIDWIQQQDADERERLMALAVKKWGDATERRCPECGAPCPEYRKTCSVCHFEIGRA